MSNPQEEKEDIAQNAIAGTVSKDRIQELVGRLRSTGGLKLKPAYAKSLTSWLNLLSKRGYLDVEFLKDREKVKATFYSAFPNPNTRSQFSRAILTYFYTLTDEEFASEYPGLTRENAVDNVGYVATRANQDINTARNLKRV